MWYISTFEAKANTTSLEIKREREEWIRQEKDKAMMRKCRTVHRYEVLGKSPLKVFFIIETDEPGVLTLLSRHFGNAWDSASYPIIQREICEALEEDHTIIGG
ncbi:MAG: hypothetical protein VST72_02545 [Nitrospirota bacterium]|nr:hypothetical protein [Nitrospirota bacterium]